MDEILAGTRMGLDELREVVRNRSACMEDDDYDLPPSPSKLQTPSTIAV